jgi:hypothetical protein
MEHPGSCENRIRGDHDKLGSDCSRGSGPGGGQIGTRTNNSRPAGGVPAGVGFGTAVNQTIGLKGSQLFADSGAVFCGLALTAFDLDFMVEPDARDGMAFSSMDSGICTYD